MVSRGGQWQLPWPQGALACQPPRQPQTPWSQQWSSELLAHWTGCPGERHPQHESGTPPASLRWLLQNPRGARILSAAIAAETRCSPWASSVGAGGGCCSRSAMVPSKSIALAQQRLLAWARVRARCAWRKAALATATRSSMTGGGWAGVACRWAAGRGGSSASLMEVSPWW